MSSTPPHLPPRPTPPTHPPPPHTLLTALLPGEGKPVLWPQMLHFCRKVDDAGKGTIEERCPLLIRGFLPEEPTQTLERITTPWACKRREEYW